MKCEDTSEGSFFIFHRDEATMLVSHLNMKAPSVRWPIAQQTSCVHSKAIHVEHMKVTEVCLDLKNKTKHVLVSSCLLEILFKKQTSSIRGGAVVSLKLSVFGRRRTH